jgi:hypothetical protein
MMIGAILLTSLWNVIFTILGMRGLYKKQKEFINYVTFYYK